jgi:hypothetical protein
MVNFILIKTSSAPGRLEKKTFYRLSIGIWCLMVVFLTNCYNGLMITDLNSPLPGSKIESFRDLLCDQTLFDVKPDFNITQWMETSKMTWFWDKVQDYFFNEKNGSLINPYETKECFRIWSPSSASAILVNVNLPGNELFWQMDHIYRQNIKDIMKMWAYSDKIMLSLLHPAHAREPQEIEKIRIKDKRYPTENELAIADELEITNCQQKSAYITDSNQISLEMYFLSRNYEKKQFYTEKNDMIRVEIEAWQFEKVGNSKIPGYYRWMIDSGIYYRLEDEKVARKNRGREPLIKIKEEKERLEGVSSLSGGLITLFMLCGGLLFLAVMSFIFLECRHIVLKLFGKCRTTISNFTVKYYLNLSMAVQGFWRKVKKYRQVSKIKTPSKNPCLNKIKKIYVRMAK